MFIKRISQRLQCFHFKSIAESFHRLKSHLTRLFFQKYKKKSSVLFTSGYYLLNFSAVTSLINRNLLADRVLDIVLSFDQSNVSIHTDYHSLALRIIIMVRVTNDNSARRLTDNGSCKSMADERQKVETFTRNTQFVRFWVQKGKTTWISFDPGLRVLTLLYLK